MLGLDRAGVIELLDTLGEAITIRDPTDQLVYANHAALRQMGFETLEEMNARSLSAIMDEYIVLDDQGRELTMSDVPSVRLLEGRSAEPLLMHTIRRSTGESAWQLLKTTPLRDGTGATVAAITVIEDVTAVKTAEVYTRVLAESGRLLAASLDYEETLRNVARAAVPAVADWCAVELVDDDLRRHHVTTAHRDPSLRELAARARAFEPEVLEPDSALAEVFISAKALLFDDVTDEQLVQGARNAEHLALMRQLGVRSVAIVPMRVPGHVIGVMTFVTSDSRRRLNEEDLALAEQLGRRAAVAVENSRLHTRISQISETLEQSLLPPAVPPIPGWEVASLYRPAETGARIELGGDFYEMFESEEQSFGVIGDVTGKGVGAATLTTLLRYGARFASRLEPDPAAVLSRLDEELRRRRNDELCTAICFTLRPGRIMASTAGHPPALVRRRSGAVEELRAGGPILGAFEDASWAQDEVAIGPDALVVLYTDGVTETQGERERYGTERLRKLVAESGHAGPQELLTRLEAELEQFRRGARRDDVAALAMRPSA